MTLPRRAHAFLLLGATVYTATILAGSVSLSQSKDSEIVSLAPARSAILPDDIPGQENPIPLPQDTAIPLDITVRYSQRDESLLEVIAIVLVPAGSTLRDAPFYYSAPVSRIGSTLSASFPIHAGVRAGYPYTVYALSTDFVSAIGPLNLSTVHSYSKTVIDILLPPHVAL